MYFIVSLLPILCCWGRIKCEWQLLRRISRPRIKVCVQKTLIAALKKTKMLLIVTDWGKVVHLPSNDPFSEASAARFSKVDSEGSVTNTPELKQSGQPASGAAEKEEGLLNKSSMFFNG